MKNKRGMIANIIGGFVAILIGVTLIGTISQEINNAIDCGINQINMTGVPEGQTNSFGGGGAGTGTFGGYDGMVHKSWSAASNLAPYKTNQTITGLCLGGDTPSAMKTAVQIIPAFFALGILAVAIAVISTAFKTSGII